MEPSLRLGFSDGTLLAVLPYYRPIHVGSDALGPSPSYVLVSGERSRYPELVRSPFLASVLMGSEGGLRNATRLTATESRSGLVSVRGGGAIGPAVTLLVSPVYGDNIGGSMGTVGSFPIATVAVSGGEFRWQGRIRLPRAYTVYHPVAAWSVVVNVHPFQEFANSFGRTVSGTGLPARAVPIVRPSPVRTAIEALTAIDESSDSSLFPVWPENTGRQAVGWVTYGNDAYRGTETTTVSTQGAKFRVVIRLVYGQGLKRSVYEVTWLVGQDGRLTQVAQTGQTPIGGVMRILPSK